MKRFIMASITSLLISACSSEPMPDFTDSNRQLNLTEFFSEPASGSGVFFDYTDKAYRHFTVTFKGEKKDNNQFVLTEDFIWSDGEQQNRVWHLTFQDDKNFTGTAKDIIGTAKGKLENNGLHMLYTLHVTMKNGKTINLNMDDRMYLTDDHTLVNRAKAKKFGITVGELVASFQHLQK